MKNKVLLVEDSQSFALTVEAAINELYDYEVIVALNFKQLKNLFEVHRDEVFAAITDLNLPDAEDGAAVKMLSSYDIPCIAFTGNYSAELRSKVLALGVADYVLKKGQRDIDYVVNMVHRLKQNEACDVLVVDDAVSSQAYLKEVLNKQCYPVEVASSAKEALALMENGYEPRIILLDLIMQEVDGFELLQELRKTLDSSRVAIIGISGSATSEQIAKFMKYGGNDFLMKPFEHEQVICRVNSNAQLLDQFDKLNQLNDQKNELLGMAAHDIRGPLGVVLSATSMLKREVITEQGMTLVNLAAEAADNMEALLNSLLDISVLENASLKIIKEKVNIAYLLKQTISEMSLMAQAKEQAIIFESPVDMLSISGDAARLKEVITNILSNAIKYSPIGQDIEVNLSHNQKKVRIQVVDEAGGIPEEERHLLFKPLSNISTAPTNNERSTGLGLAICRRIVERHKGKISYHDNHGKGSIFEVVLPIDIGRIA